MGHEKHQLNLNEYKFNILRRLCSINSSLNTLKLLDKFDAFIAGHIAKHVDKDRGNLSYLSSTIADEFISVTAKKITEMIVAKVVKAKY